MDALPQYSQDSQEKSQDMIRNRHVPYHQAWRTWKIITAVGTGIALLTFSLACTRFGPGVMLQARPISIEMDNPLALAETGPLIPPRIWQIFFPSSSFEGQFVVDPARLGDTASWLAMNPDYMYTLVGKRGADRYVEKHYADNERILRTYRALRNPRLKSDLLRYLVLSLEGGVYTDTDTVALKPIDDWVPEKMRPVVRLIVGIEYDRLGGGLWAEIPHELQFCQWTIAAAPGHSIFEHMVNRSLNSLEELADEHNTSVGSLKPTSFEVMNSTGPAAWTEVVFSQLKQADPELTSLKDLSGMKQPSLFGDILVLPIDGFGTGQGHSDSTNDGTIPDGAFLKHNFHGSWRWD